MPAEAGMIGTTAGPILPAGDSLRITVYGRGAHGSIPDRAELLLNLRTYSPAVRRRVIAAIRRIVHGECVAAGSPRDPGFEFYDQFPLTHNDAGATERVTAAFAAHFGPEQVYVAEPATASGDFSSRLPRTVA